MFTHFVTCETGQVCPGCGYRYDFLEHHPVLGKIYFTYFIGIVMNKYEISHSKFKFFSSFVQGMNITSFQALHFLPAFAGRPSW